jgi:hypothetical protein
MLTAAPTPATNAMAATTLIRKVTPQKSALNGAMINDVSQLASTSSPELCSLSIAATTKSN